MKQFLLGALLSGILTTSYFLSRSKGTDDANWVVGEWQFDDESTVSVVKIGNFYSIAHSSRVTALTSRICRFEDMIFYYNDKPYAGITEDYKLVCNGIEHIHKK